MTEQDRALTTIVELPGTLYVRYRVEDNTFLGFGFTPINDANPGFRHIAGPGLPFNPNEYGNPLWEGMKEVLANVREISGEWAFAVEWTEDGYDTVETGETQ